jgi:tungstate transport system ATP-binding protein
MDPAARSTALSALLQVRGLRVRRNETVVLQVKSLDVQRGEVLALVGPNGAGKTTLLLALAGLLGRAEGEVVFLGRPMRQWRPLDYRRRMSLVFQLPLLLDMSVADNVALGLRFRGVPREQVRERVGAWLERLGIGALQHRRAVELSGGEAQRVSLARAFVLEPELLLLDEPFPALDPPGRQTLLRDLNALLHSDHKTAVFVTHNLQEAARLSDRVAVVLGGKLRQIGAASQIKARPADSQVAAFLRTMPR